MAKRSPNRASLTAALVTSLLYGDTLTAPLEDDTAAHDAGDELKTYEPGRPLMTRGAASAQSGLARRIEDGRVVVRGDAAAANWARLAANPDGDLADEIDVSATRAADGETIRVGVTLVLSIDPDVVRAVLNDYENMPRFVPDILAARLISAGSERKRVAIEGVAHILFMTFPIHTILDILSRPDGSVAIHSVAGNLAIRAVVRVRGDGPTTRVDYQARIVPDFWLPPLIGDFLIGRQVRRQFEGMVAEMHRRANGQQRQGRTLDGSRLAGNPSDRDRRLLAGP